MKVAEIAGPVLDYWVARAEGADAIEDRPGGIHVCFTGERGTDAGPWSPSTDWAIGGPIIERERICTFLWSSPEDWRAQIYARAHIIASDGTTHRGPTPLIAAMRCYVASKFGETVSMKEAIAADVMNRAFDYQHVTYPTGTITDPEAKKQIDAALKRSMKKLP